MAETQEEKFRRMTEAPVGRLISKLAVPCIISMLVTSFYNMADTFFVGLMKSNSATGAVGVSFSMMAIIQAVGFFFGHGSGNYISRELGKKNYHEAEKMAATGFFSAFAAGIFVTNGSVASPDKDYHLEIVFPDASLCDLIGLLLANIGIEAKTITRKHDHVLYLKQNEKISDALTYFGAQNAALELIQAQVYKSFRSQTNRRTNCDLANIEKSLAAGEQQIADIRFLIEHIGLDELPENFRAVAVARLEAPEATLRDLGQMLNPPISRSGVHHRLRKLAEMAEELRNHP